LLFKLFSLLALHNKSVTKKVTPSQLLVSAPVPHLVVAKKHKNPSLLMPTGDGYTTLVDTPTATLETLGIQKSAQMLTLALNNVLLMVSHKVTGPVHTVSLVILTHSTSVSLLKDLMPKTLVQEPI